MTLSTPQPPDCLRLRIYKGWRRIRRHIPWKWPIIGRIAILGDFFCLKVGLIIFDDGSVISGYSAASNLLLDIDSVKYGNVIFTARMIGERFDLGDALIVLSSNEDELGWFHIVYGKMHMWEHVYHIIRTLASEGIVEEKFKDIRSTRGDVTLRMSLKSRKKPNSPIPLGIVSIDGDRTMIVEYMKARQALGSVMTDVYRVC